MIAMVFSRRVIRGGLAHRDIDQCGGSDSDLPEIFSEKAEVDHHRHSRGGGSFSISLNNLLLCVYSKAVPWLVVYRFSRKFQES